MANQRDLLSGLKRAAVKAAAAEEAIDRVLRDAVELEDDAVVSFSVARARPHRGYANREEDELLRRMAETPVECVVIKRRPDDYADVCVGGGCWFVLPPRLADLLEILCARSPELSAGVVAWKPYALVIEALSLRSGKELTKHALTQLVLRLRQQLRQAGANPFLVQVNAHKGLRFAVRQTPENDAGEVIGGESR